MTGGKYKSTLGPDLMALEPKKPVVVKEPAAPSQLGVGGLVPRSTAAPTPKNVEEPPARKQYEDRAKLPPPPPPEPPPAQPALEPRRCMYTGDDLPPAPRQAARAFPPGPPVTEEKYQRWRSRQQREDADSQLLFNGEGVDAPPAEPESLRRLRQLKTKVVMPETLDQHAGFATPASGKRDADLDVAWSNELEQRKWAHEQKQLGKARTTDEMDRLIANKAVSAYGERLPQRGRGDVFAPFAPRS